MFFKGALYYKLENATVSMAPKIRKMGQGWFQQGMALQGDMAHQDTLVPSLRCVPISTTKYPKALDADWVAPNAVLVGDVSIDDGASVWHGATLRGDTAEINIGKNSMIQDNSHVGSSTKGGKVTIGDNVYVGANATLDDCELESFAYVGMGASVAKGSIVESFAVVAAGANVPEGTTVPSGQIYAGSPAHYLRDLTQ
jgi:carbonic anhydrase/acetyltransferase-like protein (isoleucine patch superfamily)